MKPMFNTFRKNWIEYLIEAWGLGTFMVSAGGFGTLLFYPLSPVCLAIPNASTRLIFMGLAMGLTAMGIIYSPWGKRSGAHLNPAITLTFYRLGKIQLSDAIFYIIFQFIGGLLGVLLVLLIIGKPFADPNVNYVVTVPGKFGIVPAFIAEFIIAFVIIMMVLYTSNKRKLAPLTPFFAGCLVASYVIFESPYSGFGMNPARTVASALPSGTWTAIWLYFIAPIMGMLTGSELYLRLQNFNQKALCGKLYHDKSYPCVTGNYDGKVKCIFCQDELLK
jgi:aquaporin Z